jgi:hypothetical protein
MVQHLTLTFHKRSAHANAQETVGMPGGPAVSTASRKTGTAGAFLQFELRKKCPLLVVQNSLISGVESYSFIVPGCMFSCIVVRFSGAPPAGAARDTQC